MTDEEVRRISAWLVQRGLKGASESELLDGFCTALQQAGLALSRALLIVDTLHPIYEGRAFRWRGVGSELNTVIEYGRTDRGGPDQENWQRSPLYRLLYSGDRELRVRLNDGPLEFSAHAEMRDEGEADYFALVDRFTSDGTIGEMDCVISQWTTQRPEGFFDYELVALRELVPQLSLAVKCASTARIAETLADVYLGHDPGQRVLQGRIVRGVADRIHAVLWLSDLLGFTKITEAAAPEEIIPLLNDYADAVISAVHEAGGDVLKLIGDGTLAIFKADAPADACRCALTAERELRRKVAELNAERRKADRPLTSVYLALHIGEVFYGNIGSENRLDFTVVGPAVNEVSRILTMCRSVDRSLVISSDFAAATAPDDRANLVSVGRFALRGFGQARELFTLDPGLP